MVVDVGLTTYEPEAGTEPMPGDMVTVTFLSRTSLTVQVRVAVSPGFM